MQLLKVKIWIISDVGLANHNLDNTAINSLTVTIVSVSIVSVALVAVLVYLLVFLLHRRRVTSPFKHRRMNDGSRPRSNNMEFANRMFLQDDDDVSEEQGAFTMEELEPSTNFVNPVYETMFQVSSTAPNNGILSMKFAGHPSSHNSPECRPDQLQQLSESNTRTDRPIEKQRARPTRTRSYTHRFWLITS